MHVIQISFLLFIKQFSQYMLWTADVEKQTTENPRENVDGIDSSFGPEILNQRLTPAASTFIIPHTFSVSFFQALYGICQIRTEAIVLQVLNGVKVRLEGEENEASLW